MYHWLLEQEYNYKTLKSEPKVSLVIRTLSRPLYTLIYIIYINVKAKKLHSQIIDRLYT